MMVVFEEKSYTVKVECGYGPVESWLLLHKVLLELIRTVNTESLPPDLWVVTDFMQDMMPELESAQKML